MQKNLTRLFTAVLMATLILSAAIISVSAADEHRCTITEHGHSDPAIEWIPIYNTQEAVIEAGGHYYLAEDITTAKASGQAGALAFKAATSTTEFTLCLNGHSI